jgi:hypothetical protein
MSTMANLYGQGMAWYWSKFLDLTGYVVGWNNRTWAYNLSGYGDPAQQFSGPVTLTVRLARPRTNDEIVDPERMAGYIPDEYWVMLYPASAMVRYRDVITISTGEGPANYIVTSPTAAPWGQTRVVMKTEIRRLVNVSGPGQPVEQGWPTG